MNIKQLLNAIILFFLLVMLISTTHSQEILSTRGKAPVYIPSDYVESKSYPLLVLLHGYGFDGEVAESIWGFKEILDQYDFIYTTPNGTADPTNSLFWNATAACCNFYGSTIDDASFLFNLIESIKSNYNVDANRVYLVGDSNGGFMALEFAYRFPHLIAAVVSSAGASDFKMRVPLKSGVHALQIQGTNDTSILYSGGVIGGVKYPGLEDSTRQWVKYNQCSEIAKEASYKDLFPKIKGPETEVVTYNIGCLQDGSSEIWSILGGGHGLGRPVSPSNTLEIFDWLFAKNKSGWPSLYNGVIPPVNLRLGINNIGIFSEQDRVIYTCIRVLENGEKSSIKDSSHFDIAFEIFSSSEEKIRVIKSRPFNANNFLTKFYEKPDCSGIFETTTGVYTDIIQTNTSVLETTWSLIDPTNLILKLDSFKELIAN
jgi:polyhydroxybutyrate depolymerase